MSIYKENIKDFPEIDSVVTIIGSHFDRDPTFEKKLMGRTGVVLGFIVDKVVHEHSTVIIGIQGGEYHLWKEELQMVLF